MRILLRFTDAILLMALAGPLAWVMFCSFNPEVLAGTPSEYLAVPSLDNYLSVIDEGILASAATSLLASLVAVFCGITVSLLVVIFGLLAGPPGVHALVSVASWRVLPATLFLLPQVFYLKQINTPPLISLILLSSLHLVPLMVLLITPVAIRSHLQYRESAHLDGASDSYYVVRIMLPHLSPTIVFTCCVGFLLIWSELFTASLVLTSRRQWTLPMFLSQYITSYSTLWGELYASAGMGIVSGILLAVCTGYVLRKAVFSQSSTGTGVT